MSESVVVSQLPESLTIYEVQELAAKWLDPEQWSVSWQMDASQTREIDSCGIQLLLFLQRGLLEQGQSLSVVNADESISHSLALIDASLWAQGKGDADE
ncbi:STAS domain-containing protein [Celerinatantimonas sp. MCCC 1A17872]|uniref:STAS domain-containing protein n=1 Tax=Celerinatantimonas sp. MCCC 1A17872 TaxID=3177514 RepID=UPI0038C0D284